MKALYTTRPGNYALVERPVPAVASDEALVKVARAALCHTDAIIREGAAPHVRYPVIPGHEFSGVVESCGSDVEYLEPGARVAVHTILSCGQCSACRKGDTNACEHYDELGSKRDGGFAEYCAVPARHLFRLPERLTLAEGAMVEPLANAVSAVRQSQIKTGDKVVIVGPGPIGLLALQVARLSHPSLLILVGTRDERLALGNVLGATHTVNARQATASAKLQEIMSGKGADVVIECAGTRTALELALQVIGRRGRIAIEGVHDANETMSFSPYFLLAQAASLAGISGWVTADFVQALELLHRGLVKVEPLITHTFSLGEWETAFDLITTRKSEAIKVQLAP